LKEYIITKEGLNWLPPKKLAEEAEIYLSNRQINNRSDLRTNQRIMLNIIERKIVIRNSREILGTAYSPLMQERAKRTTAAENPLQKQKRREPLDFVLK